MELQRVKQVAVVCRGTGTEFDGLAEFGKGFVKRTLVLEDVGEVGMNFGRIGMAFEGLAVQGGGVIQPAKLAEDFTVIDLGIGDFGQGIGGTAGGVGGFGKAGEFDVNEAERLVQPGRDWDRGRGPGGTRRRRRPVGPGEKAGAVGVEGGNARLMGDRRAQIRTASSWRPTWQRAMPRLPLAAG